MVGGEGWGGWDGWLGRQRKRLQSINNYWKRKAEGHWEQMWSLQGSLRMGRRGRGKKHLVVRFTTTTLLDPGLCQLSHCSDHLSCGRKEMMPLTHLSTHPSVWGRGGHTTLGVRSTFYKRETQVWTDSLRQLDFRTFCSALAPPLCREGNVESHSPSQ